MIGGYFACGKTTVERIMKRPPVSFKTMKTHSQAGIMEDREI
jgi:hypothetical protein